MVFSKQSAAFPDDKEVYTIVAGPSGGSSPTNRSNSPTSRDEDPVFSPDGKKIAFVTDRDGNPEIYVMNVDGSGQTRLTNNPADAGMGSGFADSEPAFSPDGKKIAYTSGYDIHVMDAVKAREDSPLVLIGRTY